MDSPYKKRSDYYALIAHDNKLIAHDQPISEGSSKKRKSFHRVNDQDELDASVVNWAHFPCVVHVEESFFYKQFDTGLPRRINVNTLWFLTNLNGSASEADKIETAYNETLNTLSQFTSYMIEDQEANGRCGNLFLFDVNKAQVQRIGPINSNLYGWQLVLSDEDKARELCYKTDAWTNGVANGVNHNCDCTSDDTGGGTETGGGAASEYILFDDVNTVEIDWTSDRKTKFGFAPTIQVWMTDDDDINLVRLANVPVYADGRPPNITKFTVVLTGDSTGFITIN